MAEIDRTLSIVKSFLFFLLLSCPCTVSVAQSPPAPAAELAIFKKDLGDWDCEIRTWPAGPAAKPQVTKGRETNRMFGEHWMLTEFEGNMMGIDFKGRGTYGFDAGKKKYVGTWIDSMSPAMMHTEGTYDKEAETLTVVGDSPGPDGKTIFTNTMSTSYKDGKRVMTMYMQPKGTGKEQKMKFFELVYSKRKSEK